MYTATHSEVGAAVTARPVYGVIFDLTGTLVRFSGTREELRAAWEQGARDLYRHLADHGVTISAEDFARRLQAAFEAEMTRNGGNPREISVESVLAAVLSGFGFSLSDDEIAAASRSYFGPELARWEILPGAFEAIETLNADGFRLAVVSNAPSHLFLEEAVARVGLRPFFSPVMSSALAGARKPDPRLFQAVAADWQLDPATVVVVGDGLRADIEGARAAGMRGILVHGAENPENVGYDGAAHPAAALDHVRDVPALIERWQTMAGADHRPETGFVEDF